MPGVCKFSEQWLSDDKYATWLAPCNGDVYKARCKVCLKNFDISNMGEAAIKSHAKGNQHILRLQQATAKHTPSITLFVDAKAAHVDPEKNASFPAATKSEPNPSPGPSTSAGTCADFFSSHAVTSAEIMWAIKVVTAHFSYSACNDASDLFRSMFPDSAIAAKFSCARTKCAYLCRFGIAPYFSELLLKSVKACSEFVLLFDESLNPVTQTKQMDVYIRMWDITGIVITRYFGSVFMGHADAAGMLQKLNDCIRSLNLAKLVQISMDGPNVNWKLFDMVQNDLHLNLKLTLLDIGSCNLHIVHNAFRDGAKAAAWEIDNFLSSLFWLFKDSPARREDFTNVTHSIMFPLKMCSHRWIENVPVCERALQLLPAVCTYLSAVAAGKLTKPQNKSFEVVRQACSDELLSAKLLFCVSVAKQLLPFLTRYQSDKPMVPFLCTDLFKVVKQLMDRFVKSAVMKDITSPAKLIADSLLKEENLVDYAKVDIGFVAENAVKDAQKNKKVTDRQILSFRLSCRSWLQRIVTKLLDKTAIQYRLGRDMICIDPRNMTDTDKNLARLKSVLRHLVLCNRVPETDVDDILTQYREYSSEVVQKQLSAFSDFDPAETRLDSLLFSTMGGKKAYSKLWDIVRMLLVMSHGQATVERGFSVNRQTEEENMQEESFVARRIICDYVQYVGGIYKVDVSNKQLIVAAASARRKYTTYLEESKKSQEAEQKGKKRKAGLDEIDELKKKRQRLQEDIDNLQASADENAEKAERLHSVKYISQSNSMRRSAKEKREEVNAVEQQIEALLQQLKND